jgi:hypothetical protein
MHAIKITLCVYHSVKTTDAHTCSHTHARTHTFSHSHTHTHTHIYTHTLTRTGPDPAAGPQQAA